MSQQRKITPFLWFERGAEEAAAFYTSIFPDAQILSRTYWTKGGPMREGTLMTARIRLAGQELLLFDGGPMYRFNEAISFFVSCDTQPEIDRYWAGLTSGGQEIQCGWLKDRFGVTWQIVPSRLITMLTDSDPARVQRVVAAMMPMKKLDLARLEAAYAGG